MSNALQTTHLYFFLFKNLQIIHTLKNVEFFTIYDTHIFRRQQCTLCRTAENNFLIGLKSKFYKVNKYVDASHVLIKSGYFGSFHFFHKSCDYFLL